MKRAGIISEVLILASRFDLACDYVVADLRRRNASYFRLNTEDFDQLAITAFPDEAKVTFHTGDLEVRLEQPQLKAIFFRRGVHPREAFTPQHSPNEQLSRSHRSVFMRSFMVFDSCLWMNHPVATYRAEHKALQLATARTVGFDIPRTVITNHASGIRAAAQGDATVAIKGLDTVLVRQDDVETFGYTSLLETTFAEQAHLSSAPLVVQQALTNKLDLRVTIVGDKVFCSSVKQEGLPIKGDWRLAKSYAEFQPYALPQDVVAKCIQLTQSLGLTFGAIDLALQDGSYYFLEINPTGEWAWLVSQSNLPIDRAIADKLLESKVMPVTGPCRGD